MVYEEKTFKVENAEVLWPNFSGEEKPFNKSGDRNFCVILDPEVAEIMSQDGWNVKYTKIREEGDVERPYIQIKIKYKVRPPKVYMITSTGRTMLDEGLIGILDSMEFKVVDIIARSYDWNIEATGKSGIAAYLKTMFVTINEDELEQKYAIAEMGE